jgi:hypothetical protein
LGKATQEEEITSERSSSQKSSIDDAIKEVAAIKEAMLDSGATSNFI